MLSLQPLTAVAAPASGIVIAVCTAEGPKVMTLDRQGRPVPIRRDEAPGCAHLWCEQRRLRLKDRCPA